MSRLPWAQGAAVYVLLAGLMTVADRLLWGEPWWHAFTTSVVFTAVASVVGNLALRWHNARR